MKMEVSLKKNFEKGLKTLFESVESGEKSKEEVGEALTSLGVEPPQGAPNGGGTGGGQGGRRWRIFF